MSCSILLEKESTFYKNCLSALKVEQIYKAKWDRKNSNPNIKVNTSKNVMIVVIKQEYVIYEIWVGLYQSVNFPVTAASMTQWNYSIGEI